MGLSVLIPDTFTLKEHPMSSTLLSNANGDQELASPSNLSGEHLGRLTTVYLSPYLQPKKELNSLQEKQLMRTNDNQGMFCASICST